MTVHGWKSALIHGIYWATIDPLMCESVHGLHMYINMSVVYREGPTMRGGVRNEHKLHTSHKYRQPFGASNLVRDQSATGYMRYKERQAQTTEEEATTAAATATVTITTATVYLADTHTHTEKTQRKWAKLRVISKLFILKLARLYLPQAAPTTSASACLSTYPLLPSVAPIAGGAAFVHTKRGNLAHFQAPNQLTREARKWTASKECELGRRERGGEGEVCRGKRYLTQRHSHIFGLA